jgi:hypothetical protein
VPLIDFASASLGRFPRTRSKRGGPKRSIGHPSPHHDIALSKTRDGTEPLSFEHRLGPEPHRDRSCMRRGIRFDDPPSPPLDGLERRMERSCRHSQLTRRSVDEETGDPPPWSLDRCQRQPPVLSAGIYSREFLLQPELTPPDRSAPLVHQNAVRFSALYQGSVIRPISFLSDLFRDRSDGVRPPVEHAPAPCLNPPVFPEERFEIAPRSERELPRSKGRRALSIRSRRSGRRRSRARSSPPVHVTGISAHRQAEL